MIKQVDTIIVGAGQGGLSTSYFLKQQGREHIILEQSDKVGKAWRERWDTFTLITPNWTIQLPGAEYQGDHPDSFMLRDDVISTFEKYVEQFELPIEYGCTVLSVESTEGGYLVSTNKGDVEATNVVMATGLFQGPKIPPYSANLPADIQQLHSSQYQNPEALPDGAVLVVGSGQSGCQIAEELYQSGRKVYLSVGKTGRYPRRYHGKDITVWMEKMGFGDRTADQLPSPKAKFAGNAHGTGKDGGHTINLHQFAKDGVLLLGHIQSVVEDRIVLAPDLKENLAFADKFEAEIVKGVNNYLEKSGQRASKEILPSLRDGFDAKVILELIPKSADINSVVWAIGYKFDFSLVKLPAFDEDGYPVQKRGVTEYPGLYFIGLPFLHNIKSGLLSGVGDDAAYVTDHIVSRGVPTPPI